MTTIMVAHYLLLFNRALGGLLGGLLDLLACVRNGDGNEEADGQGKRGKSGRWLLFRL